MPSKSAKMPPKVPECPPKSACFLQYLAIKNIKKIFLILPT